MGGARDHGARRAARLVAFTFGCVPTARVGLESRFNECGKWNEGCNSDVLLCVLRYVRDRRDRINKAPPYRRGEWGMRKSGSKTKRRNRGKNYTAVFKRSTEGGCPAGFKL